MSVQNELEFFTPLCPAGHLPHKGGDQPSQLFQLISNAAKLVNY